MLYKLDVDRAYKTPSGVVNYYANKKCGKTCTVARSYDSDYTVIQGGDDVPRFVTERDVVGDTICVTNDPNDNNYNNKEQSTLVFKTIKGICIKSSSNNQSEQMMGDAWDDVFYMSCFNNGMLVLKNHQSQEYTIYPINKGRLSLDVPYRIKDHDGGLYGRRTWNMAHLLNNTLIVIPGDDEGGLSNAYCEDIHFFQFDKSLSVSGYVNVNTTRYITEKNRHKLVNYNIDVLGLGKCIGTLTFNEGWHLRFDCTDRVIFTPSK